MSSSDSINESVVSSISLNVIIPLSIRKPSDVVVSMEKVLSIGFMDSGFIIFDDESSSKSWVVVEMHPELHKLENTILSILPSSWRLVISQLVPHHIL